MMTGCRRVRTSVPSRVIRKSLEVNQSGSSEEDRVKGYKRLEETKGQIKRFEPSTKNSAELEQFNQQQKEFKEKIKKQQEESRQRLQEQMSNNRRKLEQNRPARVIPNPN